MFDVLIQDTSARFGLGNDKSRALLQMLLAHMTASESGGLPGFIERLKSHGFGERVSHWLGADAGSGPALSAEEVTKLFGGPSGLLRALASRLGLDGQASTSALSFLLPAAIGKLTPSGGIPANVPRDVTEFIGDLKDHRKAVADAAVAQLIKTSTPNRTRWMPWLLLAAAIALLVTYCSKSQLANDGAEAMRKAAGGTTATAAAVAKSGVQAVTDAAKLVDDMIPTGAGTLASMLDGVPSLKVYFDTGKAELSLEFPEKSKAVIDYLKTHTDTRAVLSGFTDTSGDPVLNEALSKKRAETVADALKAAGVPAHSVVLEKPAQVPTAKSTDAELRRVEVVLRK